MEKLTNENKSFPVKYCKQCKECYEIVRKKEDGSLEYFYYKDFPTIGLQRVRCPECPPKLSNVSVDDLQELIKE